MKQSLRRRSIRGFVVLAAAALTVGVVLAGCGATKTAIEEAPPAALVAEGQRVFRFDTFGDEQVWTDALRLHEVVEKHVDPMTALTVGLKVDADVLPPGILDTGRTPRARPARRTGPHRSARSGSTRPIFTTAARPRSPTS